MKYLLIFLATISYSYSLYSFGRSHERNMISRKKLHCALSFRKNNSPETMEKFYEMDILHLNGNAFDAYWEYKINKCLEGAE